MADRRAFSMIELVIVILIIGLTAAIAAPRMADSVSAARLHAAANQLAAHIDYVRNVAVNEARTTTIVCDNVLHSYGSSDVDFPEKRGELLQVFIQQTHDPELTLTADFDTKTSLTFDFEGVPHVGGTPLVSGQITLAFESERFRINIAPGTGLTTVTRVQSNTQPVKPAEAEPLEAFAG